ncbi:MAG TPA: protein kinase [Gemmataceae bacterium]|nr:protein kinase [Gemmataceae bacterium]
MLASIPCPNVDDYRRLVSGQLAETQAEELLGHLETCAACAGKIQTLPASDTLVDWIQQAKVSTLAPQDKPLNPLIQHLIQLGKPSGRLTFSCSGCGKPLRVKVEAAGKKVKCPHCAQVMTAPKAGGTGVAPVASQTAASADMETLGLPSSPNDASKAGASSATPMVATWGLSSKERELCSFLAPSQAPDELGRLGPYRVLKVLGAGGMGVVFRAEDPHLQRMVAIKAMLPGLAENEGLRQRFLREARLAASLKHDHIVTIHQVGEDRGAPFLAMEFLEGESLEDRLKSECKLPLAEVLRIGREIADGLQAAHERGLIHRDIKPGNIWLEKLPERGASAPRFRVKILDFGLARTAVDDVHLTQSGAIVGTPAYMPPEQARGEKVDARCDLYSLGCVLYRLCTGELPFKGDNAMSLLLALAIDKPKSPCEVNPDVPPPLADLILCLLAKDPAQRPASAAIVAEDLQALERSLLREQESREPKTVLSPPSQVKTAPNKRRLVVAIAAGLLGVAVVLAGIVIIIRNRKGEETARIHVPDDSRVEIVNEGAKADAGVKASPSKEFFNGKDLEGWEGLKEYWSVKDGVLVGTLPPEKLDFFNTFLCSKKKYRDFELSFQVRLKEGKGNSGIQIRSWISAPETFGVRGPQCEIGDMGWPWGSLVTEPEGDPGIRADKDAVARVLKENDFNNYSIKCVGKHVTIKLNGITTVDADFPTLPDEGIIAWQLHTGHPGMEVAFKNIAFQELPPRRAGISPPVQVPEPPPLAEWLKGRETLTVSQDGLGQFKTIQAALNVLQQGQIVKVLDRGPYRERLQIDHMPPDSGLISEHGTILELSESKFIWKDPEVGDVFMGHLFSYVDGFRLSGFGLLFPDKRPEKAKIWQGLAVERCDGFVLENCWIRRQTPPEDYDDCVALKFRQGGHWNSKSIFVRECFFEGNLIIPSMADGGRAVIERNFFLYPPRPPLHVQGPASYKTIVIRHNVFGDATAARGIWITGIERAEWFEISNNTLTSNNLSMIDNKIPAGTGVVCNNLRNHPGFLSLFNGAEKDVAAALRTWQVGHNAYPRQFFAEDFGWSKENIFPQAPTDILFPVKFLSMDLGNRDYLRILADSPLAKGGAGGAWPSYIGALPPGPAPKDGDWFTRLRAKWMQEQPATKK